MNRTLTVGIVGALLGLAGVAQAQTADSGAPAAAPTPPPAAVKSGPPSIDWPIADLIADPGSKAVLTKDLPALMSYDGLDQIKSMSIRQISQFPQANIDAPKLAQIQADLSAATPAAH